MTGAAASAPASTWVVFQQPGGEVLALPGDAVVKIGRAPKPTPMPFAPPGVDGVISHGGGIVPLISLAALLRPDDAGSIPAPGGDLIVVRSAGTHFALRVGRVLFSIAVDGAAAAAASAAEPEPAADPPSAVPSAVGKMLTLRGRRVGCLAVDRLGLAALAAWQPAAGEPGPVADARQAAAVSDDAIARRRQAIIAVRAGGEVYGLPSTVVAEMFDGPIPVTRLPLVPPIVSGVAVLGGTAMVVFSLARLLGLDEEEAGSGSAAVISHVAVRVGDGRLLIAVDRILGLHHLPARRRAAASLVTVGGLRVRRVLEVSELIEPKMLAMIARIGRAEVRRQDCGGTGEADGGGRAYLSLTVGGRLCALALDAVDRIVEPPQHPIRLPDGAPEGLHGAVSVAGEILPLTDGRRWLQLRAPASAPAAAPAMAASLPSPEATVCVILRGDAGRHALVADAVHRIVRIPDRAVFPTDDPDGRVMAVGEIEGRAALILATSRLMSAPGAVE